MNAFKKPAVSITNSTFFVARKAGKGKVFLRIRFMRLFYVRDWLFLCTFSIYVTRCACCLRWSVTTKSREKWKKENEEERQMQPRQKKGNLFVRSGGNTSATLFPSMANRYSWRKEAAYIPTFKERTRDIRVIDIFRESYYVRINKEVEKIF